MSLSGSKPATGAWYREPWVWLVVALPSAAVAGGLVTLALAIHGSDDVVRDDFRKEGLAIYADPARDAAAVEVGARSTLTFDAGAGELRARLSLERGAAPKQLLVVLSHATRAEYDRLVTLSGHGGSYSGQLAPLQAGHWYLEVTPENRQWRLRGSFEAGQSTVELAAVAR